MKRNLDQVLFRRLFLFRKVFALLMNGFSKRYPRSTKKLFHYESNEWISGRRMHSRLRRRITANFSHGSLGPNEARVKYVKVSDWAGKTNFKRIPLSDKMVIKMNYFLRSWLANKYWPCNRSHSVPDPSLWSMNWIREEESLSKFTRLITKEGACK